MNNLSEQEIDRVIEMAWEDRTPFEAISYQFGLKEEEVIQLMRNNLKEKVGKDGEKECKEERQNILNLDLKKLIGINLLDKNKSQGIGFQRDKYILLCHILKLI